MVLRSCDRFDVGESQFDACEQDVRSSVAIIVNVYCYTDRQKMQTFTSFKEVLTNWAVIAV